MRFHLPRRRVLPESREATLKSLSTDANYPALPRISLALTTLAFAGFGTALLLNPDLLSHVGVTTTRPAGSVELRGFYGGLELGMAVFFALSVSRRAWHVPALLVQVLSLGGAVVGRLVGLALDGGAEPLIFALLAAESGATAFGAVALRAALAHARAL